MKMIDHQQIKRLLIYMLAVLLVLTTLAPEIAVAKSNMKAGTLTVLQGDVYVTKGGGKREMKAFEGMRVTQGDHIRTSKNASVKVVLNEYREILLGANTQILLSELVGNDTVIKLSSGSLWNKVKGILNAEDRFIVETPTSIMGVRGTLFMVQVGGDGRTNLSVLDGIVGINRPNSGPSSVEQVVNVDEQVNTGVDSTIPTPALLDIPQFVQETDIAILVQMILDELEAAKDQMQKASEYERLYENLNLPDYLIGAVEEAHLASLLSHITEAIMREIEQSTRYQEIEQAFRDQGISWEATYREARNRIEQTESRKAEIERAAEREKILQERQEQLRRELQDKIDRHRSGESTSPAPSNPTRPPTSGGGTTPPSGTTVTATFDNGRAVASGMFNGISYTISIPYQSGDGDTISFVLRNPPSIPVAAGPVHALDIRGLEDREENVTLTLSIPEDLSHEPQGYHHEGNGRWEPRGTERNVDGETVTFVTDLSAVAVAAKIPAPFLEVDATPINVEQYSVQLAWSKIDIEGVGYKLYRSSESHPNAVEIWSTTDYTENMYIDTVEVGQTYFYTIKVVRAGFESFPSNTVIVHTAPIGEPKGIVTGEVYHLSSPDYEPLTGIKIKVWDADREHVISSGTTDSSGHYSIQVPAGGPYRITAEYMEEPGHAYEIYDGKGAVADLFLRHYQVDNSDPYTFSVAEGAVTFIPEFPIVPYEKVENLTAEVSDHHFAVSWDEYPEALLHKVYIYDNEYLMGSNTFTASAQPETTYEVGVAAWGPDYPLAIGLIEFTTDPIPKTGTVTGAVYSAEYGYLSNIPIKVWNQERTALIDGDVTDGNGQFMIPYVPISENYRLTAEYQGQAYELYERGPGEYRALSAFSMFPPRADDQPYTFSVKEGASTDVGEIFIEYDSMFSPSDQIENLRITDKTRETITIAWEPYQVSNFRQYKVFVNGEEIGEVDENDTASTTFTIGHLEPATYYEIAVGLWEAGADGATVVNTIFVRTS